MADPGDDTRHAHLVRGMQAFSSGDWQVAIDALTAAAERGGDEVRFALTRASAWGRLMGDAAMRDELARALAWSDDAELHLRLARVSLKLGDFPAADRHGARAVAIAPDSKDVRLVAFEVASRLGRLPDAAAHLEAAIAVAPTEAALLLRAMRFFANHRDAERALQHASSLVVLDPSVTEAWVCVVESALELGRTDTASTALAELDARAPDAWRRTIALRVRLGDVDGALERLAIVRTQTPSVQADAMAATFALWRNDHETARALSDAVLAREPEHAEACVVRGALLVLAGRATEAIPALERARDSLRAHPDADAWMTEDVPCVWIADAWRTLGDWSRSSAFGHLAMAAAVDYNPAAHVQRLLSTIRPTDDPDRPLAPKAYLRLMRHVAPLLPDPQTFPEGTVHGVSEALESVLARLGGNRSPWSTVVQDGHCARWIAPPWPRNRARLLQHLLKTRTTEHVLSGFRDLQAAFPDDPTPHTYHGEVLLWAGRYAEAETEFRAALDREQTTTWAWIGLGAVSRFLGHADEALARWRQGVEVLQYEGPTLFVYRAEANVLRGDADAALPDLDRAIVSKPERLSAWLDRALLDARRGDVRTCATMVARIRERLPGLACDVLEATTADDDAPSAVEAMLAAMRGNRSSTLITWHDAAGRMRFGAWGRWYKAGDLFPSAGALLDSRRASLKPRIAAR